VGKASTVEKGGKKKVVRKGEKGLNRKDPIKNTWKNQRSEDFFSRDRGQGVSSEKIGGVWKI